jgi:predicted CoA-binding protein
MVATDRKAIDAFLDRKRLAVVGVSRNANDFSRMVFREFEKQGYDVVPVNPGAPELEGKRCFAHVGDIEPPVDAALLFTPPRDTAGVVDECVSANIHHVWMHRGAGGPGAVSEAAVAVCREHGINFVAGECPMMFLPNNAWFHRFHGLLKKIAGTFPN